MSDLDLNKAINKAYQPTDAGHIAFVVLANLLLKLTLFTLGLMCICNNFTIQAGIGFCLLFVSEIVYIKLK